MRLVPGMQGLLTLAFAIGGAAWGGLLSTWHLEGRATVLDRMEALTLDLRFLAAGTREPPSQIVIVAIDDETVREAGPYPLPRETMARLIRAIADHEPKAIALDLLFVDRGQPEADAALADALGAARTVVAAVGLFAGRAVLEGSATRGSTGELALSPAPASVLFPIDPVQRAARVGLVNISTDHSGTPRHLPLIFRYGDGVLPSFALATAALASGRNPAFEDEAVLVGERTSRLDLGHHLPIRFYGPSGAFERISAARVLKSDVPARNLEGRIVVIGATAVGAGDSFATPFDQIVPGVEILATAIGNLAAGDGLVRTAFTRRIDTMVAVFFPVVAVALIALRRTMVGFAAIAALAALWAALTVLAFMQGYWFSTMVPLAALAPTAAFYGIARLWLERRRAKRLAEAQESLRRFQPPAFAKRLAADPLFLTEPVQQDAAIMFVDLSGFTGLSERIGPDRTRVLLKSFHSFVEEVATAHGGFVVNFMGDGAMIVFGFPECRPNEAACALAAALDLSDRVRDWLHGQPPPINGLSARVGAHFGPVVVSRLGSDVHEHITASGDTVNVASRLLEVAKRERASLVVSDDLAKAAETGEAGLAAAGFGRLMELAIRGRSRPLAVRLRRAAVAAVGA